MTEEQGKHLSNGNVALQKIVFTMYSFWRNNGIRITRKQIVELCKEVIREYEQAGEEEY